MDFCVFQFVPFASCLVTAEKRLVPSFLLSHFPFRYLYTLIKSPLEPSILQIKQYQLSQTLLICQMLQLLNYLCGFSLDPLQYVYDSLPAQN